MKQITMKKKVKQLCCILLAVILCMGMTVPAMAASSRYYNDGNGIPELLMHNSSAGINEIRTYNPKTRKNVRAASVGYGKGYNFPIKYSRTCHTVMLCNANTGGTEYCIYRVRGTKATRIVKAERFNGRFQKGYKVNGKRVSGSTYSRSVKKYMQKAGVVWSSGM